MKKLYSSLILLVSAASLNAQLTQANHAPAATETYELFRCDSVNINPGASGASATWNFAGVATYSSLVRNYSVQAVSTTTYPSAGTAVASAPNDISYLASSANKLLYYGGNIAVGAITGGLTYTNPAIFAAYPMSLNTTSSTAITGTLIIPALSQTGGFTGTSSVLVDGSGTINLPGGVTHTNTLRVVTTQTMNVTTSLANATVTQVDYNYYAAGIKPPVFTISTATAVIGGIFASTTTQTMVARLKNNVLVPVGIVEGSASSSVFEVYPNPANAAINFVSNSLEAKLVSIYDITGKLVDKQTMTDGKVKVDVSSYNKGLYIYVISASNNKALKSGKITVSQ